jgi:hypothetical protein
MDKAKVLLEIVNGISVFPEKDKMDIEEYIKHDEWGIALETICSAVLEDRILVDKKIFKKISDVGTEMEMDSSLWNDIARLINDN